MFLWWCKLALDKYLKSVKCWATRNSWIFYHSAGESQRAIFTFFHVRNIFVWYVRRHFNQKCWHMVTLIIILIFASDCNLWFWFMTHKLWLIVAIFVQKAYNFDLKFGISVKFRVELCLSSYSSFFYLPIIPSKIVFA